MYKNRIKIKGKLLLLYWCHHCNLTPAFLTLNSTPNKTHTNAEQKVQHRESLCKNYSSYWKTPEPQVAKLSCDHTSILMPTE